jgi:hypothetical protein
VRQHVRTEKALETERDFFAAVLESADAFILVFESAGAIADQRGRCSYYPLPGCSEADVPLGAVDARGAPHRRFSAI